MHNPLLDLVILLGREGKDFDYFEPAPEWWALRFWLAESKPYWAVINL